jgi:excisionase family DNA binding protein
VIVSKASPQARPGKTPPEGRTGLGTTAEVAEYLKVPEHTLVQWRYKGTGPRYSSVGRHVRYRWADVDRWIDENATDPSSAT